MKTKTYVRLFVGIVAVCLTGNMANATMYGDVDVVPGIGGNTDMTVGGITLHLTPDQTAYVTQMYMADSTAAIRLVDTFASAVATGNANNLIGLWNTWHTFIQASVTSGTVNVTCMNWATTSVAFTLAGWSAWSGLPSSTPPSPSPMGPTGSSASVAAWACSYVEDLLPDWSDCMIDGSWTVGWTISCTQTNSWRPVYQSCSCGSCPSDMTRSPQTVTKTVTMNIVRPASTCNGSQYANNSDTCQVKISISAPTEDGKWISNWGGNGNITNIVDVSWEKSDRIGNVWNALNFSSVTSSGISNSTTNNFTLDIVGIRAVSPFVSFNGQISFQIWGVGMNANNIPYSFKKPFTGHIQTSADNGASWSASPKLGTEMLYRVVPNIASLGWTDLTSYALNDFSSAIQPYGSGLDMQSKSVIGSTLNSTTWTQFRARINSSADATSLNQTPGLQISLPIISYTLGGQSVRYSLSAQDIGNDATPIRMSWDDFIWVRILGGLQGGGKSQFTGQRANISSIATSDMRTKIRQNAYAYTRNMTSGQLPVGGVKYVIGDVTLSWEPDYETLVVRDGNVTINGDLNTSGKKFGIIVLKDGYDINTDYTGKWNVYVTPNVTTINAVIYADGGFISADASGSPYTADSSDRTYALRNQLFMNGSLFTRNTIGGAVLAGGKYVLPGGSVLPATDTGFDKAMVYDLNYVRRWNAGCDKNGNGNCSDAGEYAQSFVIRYDSRIQTSPVKLFAQ